MKKMSNRMNAHAATLLLIGLSTALTVLSPGAKLAAQGQDLHVITKKLEKRFAYQSGYEVNIEGEKADVSIMTWDRDEILFEVQFVARHPDKAVAEADVEKMKYVADRVRNKIYVRNYLSIAEGEAPPASNMQAKYQVKVPKDCPVYLKNYFGAAQVANLEKRFRYQGEFSPLGLENVSGEIDMDSRFGDIQGRQLDGQIQISTRRSDLVLEEIQGRYNIQAEYGEIRILSASSGLLDLNIQAEKSNVYLFDRKLLENAYALTAAHGRIIFPSDLRMEFLKNTEALKQVSFQPQQEYYPNITISVSFGDIYLEKDKNSGHKGF